MVLFDSRLELLMIKLIFEELNQLLNNKCIFLPICLVTDF
jgi:hypothetical protein